ncbi:MAG: hypothetical protein QNJ55_01690 [Xenococcus sp. MO_188.B8]|nr:hypothetical protein [Xenococcus sp. MO_188.B8]
MEPIVTTIATLVFSKALEKGSEQLGEAISDKIGQLINLIRERFKQQGMEGALVQAENNPTEDNKKFFQQVLERQMRSDSEFAHKLKILMNELESNEQVHHIFFKGVNVKGDAEIGDVEQTATGGGSVTQEAFTEVEIGGNLKIGNFKQQG